MLALELKAFKNSGLYRHEQGSFTEGVLHLAERAKAFWLIDVIFSYNVPGVWVLSITDAGAILTCRADDEIVIRQNFGTIEFPMPSVTLLLLGGTLQLPTE